jgi:hypothetical protein
VRFATGPAKHVRGAHGGPSTTRNVAVISGGHPIVSLIAERIAATPPHLADWAPTIAAVLGVDLPEAEGQDLGAKKPAGSLVALQV